MVSPPAWFSALLPARLRRGSHTISPTAHYTGYVWAHHGLGDPSLATAEGRIMHALGRAALTPIERLGGPTLEHFLLARHRIIDHRLDEQVAAGEVRQVVELAAGMSPRGLELVRRHPDLTVVEVDLPAMAARKRQALDRVGTDPTRHRVVTADVFSAGLSTVFDRLDPAAGVAVVTEGLLNYFPTDRVVALWTRLAEELRPFPHGLYLSDLHVTASTGLPDRVFADADLLAPVDYAGVLPGMTAAGAGRVRVVEAHAGRRRSGGHW